MLGIDAAWTPHHASGYALVAVEERGPRCLLAAESARAFLRLLGREVDDEASAFDAVPGVVAETFGPLAVAAVDMPLAPQPIRVRRAAEDALARAYGARGIGTHSPLPDRPGQRSPNLLELLGLPLRTANDPPGHPPAALETYPHPALLELLGARYRVPYKVSRSRRAWPDATATERIAHLQRTLRAIEDALALHVRDLPAVVPRSPVAALAHLKPVEDLLDALVCAWVGTRWLAGRARAYGDRSSAIWVPTSDGSPIEIAEPSE